MYCLALDEISSQIPLPSGMIVAMSPNEQDLRDLGYQNPPYTGQRLVSVDETDAAVWDMNVEPGWYYHNGSVQATRPKTTLDLINEDIVSLQSLVDKVEASDLLVLMSRHYFDPQLDSGHSWLNDIIHAWVKPYLRLVESKIAEEKAKAVAANPLDPANRNHYLTYFARLVLQAQSPGLKGFWDNADKSVWRAMRDGLHAAEFDPDTGGYRSDSGHERVNITYPTGHTVVTWMARRAILEL